MLVDCLRGLAYRVVDASAKTGDPMPSIPQMDEVWDPFITALTNIYQQTLASNRAMTEAAAAVRAKIG